MLSDRSLHWLDDIRDNIVLAMSFIGGHDEASFEAEIKTFYAAVRCLEIISEASRRLPDDMKARHPSTAWPQVAAAGNVYRHNYPDIAPVRVWETVKVALPPLLAVVETELDGA